jgi:restriction endonuclease
MGSTDYRAHQIDNLDALTPEERKDFLENTVTEIRVETTDKQTNKLHIEFLTPLVEDSFEWKHPKDKKLGYDITGGKLLKTIDFDVGK